jgi:heme/copper-type cytochrome/quinol oxidase subunit 2
LLIVGAVISFLTIPSHLLDMFVSPFNENQEVSDNPSGFLALMLTAVLGLATIAVYIATVIAFLMWLYRASNNIAAFGQRTMHSSGWAVGSFFVPIMNLFVPYQATKDIWTKSAPEASSFSFSTSPPGFFAAWWGFWIASNIASNIYIRLTLAEAPQDATSIVGIFSELLSIAAVGFAIKVVRDIDRRQEERSRNLPQQSGPMPPAPPVFQASPTAPIAGSPATPTTPLDQSNSATTGA